MHEGLVVCPYFNISALFEEMPEATDCAVDGEQLFVASTLNT